MSSSQDSVPLGLRTSSVSAPDLASEEDALGLGRTITEHTHQRMLTGYDSEAGLQARTSPQLHHG